MMKTLSHLHLQTVLYNSMISELSKVLEIKHCVMLALLFLKYMDLYGIQLFGEVNQELTLFVPKTQEE